MSSIALKAKALAKKAHSKQKRKTSREPFITHLIEVNNILKKLTDDEDILAIGWLHDLVEDTEYELSDLKDFPDRVLQGVKAESEDKSLSWKDRKTKQIEELKKADETPLLGENVLMVTFADKLANMRDLLSLYNKFGLNNMFNDFNEKDINEQYWYYNSFYEIFSEHKHLFTNELMNEYKSILSEIWGK